jgi:hypothetical protein
MSKHKLTYDPENLASFQMKDGSVRRIRAKHLPTFAGEALDGGKSKGAEALSKCVAVSKNAAGIVRLLAMLEEK